ncbi:MAG: hypothetical protein V3W20_10470 [Candidatus Neomarinimicrobiota bacterium]
MFTTFCYYFLSSGLVASACFGTYYFFDKEGATRFAFNVSWQGVSLYVKTQSYIDRLSNVFSSTKDQTDVAEDFSDTDDEEIKSPTKFILFNLHNETVIAMDKISEEMENMLGDSSGDYIQFLHHADHKFLRLTDTLTAETDKDTFDFIKSEKPFIQVELEQNGETLEIHKYLKEHYYEGNKILDRDFLLWYMHYNNLGELSEGYQLKVIDSNVEMFTMQPNQYIMLTADGYECVTDEQ